jgi:hypothetical protein
MSDATLPRFKSLDWYTIPGRGRVAAVECDIERPRDQPGLLGKLVIIDGETFVCIGVERRLPAGPIQPGEKIGLLVRPPG